MTLVVCPLASLGDVCRDRRPSHLLSLVSPGGSAPDVVGPLHSLHLAVNDIAAPRAGFVAPDRELVSAVLAFGRTWDARRPMVVACFAGVSRSTAAAFMLACQAAPPGTEHALARALRAAGPCSTPNPLMVELADGVLGREGRMTAAIRAIGRGADYAAFTSFDLAVNVERLEPGA